MSTIGTILSRTHTPVERGIITLWYGGKPNDEDAVLVVAGDVSDNMDTTIQYISSLTTFYNEVLFIDGNHESCVSYPDLLSDTDISSKARTTHNATRLVDIVTKMRSEYSSREDCGPSEEGRETSGSS